MKVIDCNEIVKKKNELSIIYQQLNKIKNKIIRRPVYLDKDFTASQFISENYDELVILRNFLHEIDVSISCAFVEHNLLRFSILLKYRKKKKTKLVKIVRDFIKEAEDLFAYLDNIKIEQAEGCYYIDLYKNIEQELFEREQERIRNEE